VAMIGLSLNKNFCLGILSPLTVKLHPHENGTRAISAVVYSTYVLLYIFNLYMAMKFAYINILYAVNAQSAKIGQESMGTIYMQEVV
jgi:hypothetical protein